MPNQSKPSFIAKARALMIAKDTADTFGVSLNDVTFLSDRGETARAVAVGLCAEQNIPDEALTAVFGRATFATLPMLVGVIRNFVRNDEFGRETVNALSIRSFILTSRVAA